MPSLDTGAFEIRGIGAVGDSNASNPPQNSLAAPRKLSLNLSRLSIPPPILTKNPFASKDTSLPFPAKGVSITHKSVEKMPLQIAAERDKHQPPVLPLVHRRWSKPPLNEDGVQPHIPAWKQKRPSAPPGGGAKGEIFLEGARVENQESVNNAPKQDATTNRPTTSLSLRERAYLRSSSGSNSKPASSGRGTPNQRQVPLPTPGFARSETRSAMDFHEGAVLDNGSRYREESRGSNINHRLPPRPASVASSVQPGHGFTNVFRGDSGTAYTRNSESYSIPENGPAQLKTAGLFSRFSSATGQSHEMADNRLSGAATPETQYRGSRTPNFDSRAPTGGGTVRFGEMEPLRVETAQLMRQNEELRRENDELRRLARLGSNNLEDNYDMDGFETSPLRVPPTTAKTAVSTARSAKTADSTARRSVSTASTTVRFIDGPEAPRDERIAALRAEIEEHRFREDSMRADLEEAIERETLQSRASHSAASTAPPTPGPVQHSVTVGKWQAERQRINENSTVAMSPSARLTYPDQRWRTLAYGGGGSYAYSALGRGPIMQGNHAYIAHGHMVKNDDLEVTKALDSQRRTMPFKRGMKHKNDWQPGGFKSNLCWETDADKEIDPDNKRFGYIAPREPVKWANAGAGAYRSWIQSAVLRPPEKDLPFHWNSTPSRTIALAGDEPLAMAPEAAGETAGMEGGE